ncbi:MAG: diaminopimelate decarboxylase [Candidatus Omnitrophota bacterium]|nr:diaminopimelate decarboxylase [Candidatus Omnitrophota bacterium]
MHDFKYRKNQLFCEDVPLQALARRYGTPLYVYSYHTLTDHYRKLSDAFKSVKPLICYSVKANSNLTILRSLIGQGAGLDIVSGGELFRALKAGCNPRKIVYASVGKTNSEIAIAIKKGILFFNVESLAELSNINRIAAGLRKKVNVAIRINPDVEPKTHKFITTGALTNKFGIDFETAYDIFATRKNFVHLTINGLHIHIGSQITDPGPYVAAFTKVLHFIQRLTSRGITLESLNIGGGLGIIYNTETPQTARDFAKKILPILRATKLQIIMEPGRFIIGNAGIMVTKVLYLKSTPLKKFIVVDAGMNDLLRPALYEAYHQIIPLRKAHRSARTNEKVDIVGPICESGDFIAKDRMLADSSEGQYLAIMGAGAYGFSMASNYNSRRRPAEVMVRGKKVFCIRKRESFEDLIRNEIVHQ